MLIEGSETYVFVHDVVDHGELCATMSVDNLLPDFFLQYKIVGHRLGWAYLDFSVLLSVVECAVSTGLRSELMT